MILLGFADDVLDVRWRYKVWFPAIAGIPLMIFYYTNKGVTYVMMPVQLRPYVGDLVDLGIACKGGSKQYSAKIIE
jgi:UDP-N-acetylglucosamine--dolichyl-phosphate N-acetylglucosaminephosphotransferase